MTAEGLCVSGPWDNTLRVWDIRSGECLDVLQAMEVDASHMDLSLAVLDDPDLARQLWQRGAVLPPEEQRRQAQFRENG